MCFQEIAFEISGMEIQIFQKKIEVANEMVDVDCDLWPNTRICLHPAT